MIMMTPTSQLLPKITSSEIDHASYLDSAMAGVESTARASTTQAATDTDAHVLQRAPAGAQMLRPLLAIVSSNAGTRVAMSERDGERDNQVRRRDRPALLG